MRERRRRTLVTGALVAGLLVVVVGSYLVGALASADPGFAGTDQAVTSMLEADGVRPWFWPVVRLGSAELESGLFALQAALGAGVLGFVLGHLHGRSTRSRTPKAGAGDDADTDEPGTGQP